MRGGERNNNTYFFGVECTWRFLGELAMALRMGREIFFRGGAESPALFFFFLLLCKDC